MSLRFFETPEAREKRQTAWTTPKRLRPKCGAKCHSGLPCQARVVWDKKNDKPVNGLCLMHGKLNTGSKTKEGRE